MLVKKRWEQQWFHFYKWIACIGIISVIIPVFEMVFGWFTKPERVAWMISFLVVPILVVIGYMVQYIFLGSAKEKIYATTLDFTFENQKASISKPRLLLAFVITFVLAAGIGYLSERFLFKLLGIELVFPIFIILCPVTAMLGCCLVPFRFHQLLGIRTFVECTFVFSLVYAFQIFVGDGTTFCLYACILIFSFCFFVSLNQAYVIKPTIISKSCYATNALRVAGIKSVMRYWFTAFALQLPLLGILSLLITPFFLFLSGYDFEHSFIFPFVDYPIFNAVLFGCSLLLAAVATVYLLIHFRNGEIKFYIHKLCNWIQRMWERFIRWISSFHNRIEIYIPKLFEEPKQMDYVDTVTQIPAVVSLETAVSFQFVQRKMKTFGTIREKYCYAYRILLGNLYESQIGLAPHQTLLEMVTIVKEKTNLENFNSLTNVFLEIIYAEHTSVTERDLENLLQMLKTRLKK